MDPFRDTIPDDHGEDLKKHMRERDGSDEDGRPKKRPRTDTNAVLPPEIRETADPPVPLKAEEDLTKYTSERLQRGLAHVEGAAKRNITPRTQEFLKLHKEAYKVALTGTAPQEPALAVVKKMDEVYHSAAFFLRPRDGDQQEKLMLYLKLRKMELLATYGDYLGHTLAKIRADLKQAARISDDDDVRVAATKLSGRKTWTQISEELDGANAADLRENLEVASNILGVDAGHMEWVINQYAARCLTFHNAVAEDIKKRDWYVAATRLCRDLRDLINVVEEPERARYETVLLCIRDEFWDVVDPDNPQGWFANEKARTLTREKVARDAKKAGTGTTQS